MSAYFTLLRRDLLSFFGCPLKVRVGEVLFYATRSLYLNLMTAAIGEVGEG